MPDPHCDDARSDRASRRSNLILEPEFEAEPRVPPAVCPPVPAKTCTQGPDLWRWGRGDVPRLRLLSFGESK
eukprot:scaffold88906_cov30-Tisochrysis_lutea.AAC.1